ncbi:MAG: hypothetical protein PHQ86_07050 [Dehalococcoidales bacterium]|nr:hypothetical protein [Dehalococcoidales bacterium]
MADYFYVDNYRVTTLEDFKIVCYADVHLLERRYCKPVGRMRILPSGSWVSTLYSSYWRNPGIFSVGLMIDNTQHSTDHIFQAGLDDSVDGEQIEGSITESTTTPVVETLAIETFGANAFSAKGKITTNGSGLWGSRLEGYKVDDPLSTFSHSNTQITKPAGEYEYSYNFTGLETDKLYAYRIALTQTGADTVYGDYHYIYLGATNKTLNININTKMLASYSLGAKIETIEAEKLTSTIKLTGKITTF